jgi:polar amino acid transport system substrate-binding protein
VSQNNGRLLSSANIALGQMMQAYVDGDAGTREMVNRWIGPTSSVKLTETAITGLYSLILSTTAEMSTSVKAGS